MSGLDYLVALTWGLALALAGAVATLPAWPPGTFPLP